MKKKLFSFFLIFCLLFLFSFLPFFRQTTLKIFEPLLFIFQKTGDFFQNGYKMVKSIKDLAKENEELKKELLKKEVDKTHLLELENENQILRKQLNFLEENKKINLLPAYVIGKAPNTFLEYLIINKGKKDGLSLNSEVIFEGCLVGKIVELSDSTSKVFLITNPNSAIPALTSESRQNGIVKGQIGYGLVLEDLPKENALKIGENVITSGLGGEYQKGLLLGRVEKIISKESDLFQKASLSPFLDFGQLEIIFILKR